MKNTSEARLPKELYPLYRYMYLRALGDDDPAFMEETYELLREGLYQYQMLYMRSLWSKMKIRPKVEIVYELGCGKGGMLELYGIQNPKALLTGFDKTIPKEPTNITIFKKDLLVKRTNLSLKGCDVFILSEFLHTKSEEQLSNLMLNIDNSQAYTIYVIERQTPAPFLNMRLKRAGKRRGMWTEREVCNFMNLHGWKLTKWFDIGVHYAQRWERE